MKLQRMLEFYQFDQYSETTANRIMISMSTLWLRAVFLLTAVVLSRRTTVYAQERCSELGELRLVNGTNAREGRVEICIRGEWGTICDDLWDGNDAEVVCRQLGFATSGAIAAAGAYFGAGTGPILLDNVKCTGDERRLTACPNQRIGQHNCLHSEDASVICQPENYTCPTGAVRLAGGQEPNEGRVEICVNNQYGTICDDNWDDRDAAVVCAQLGFSRMNAIAVTRTQAYGIGIGNIYFDEIKCFGNESNITECRHAGVGNHNCGHLEDAAVLCRPNTPPKVCEDGDIRLQGGRTRADGRVEICFNDRWGTVCDDNFGVEEAAVVCRQQGFLTKGAIPVGNAAYEQGTGSIFLDNLACFGNETFLKDCRHDGIGNHNCGHTEDASVICSNPIMEECTNGSVQLVNGTTAYEGRVEICVNNHWGTICDDQWDSIDATVVCRQLGFTNGNAIALPRAIFGSGKGIIWFDDMQCLGNEATLLNCTHRGFGISNCGHTEDANVLCPVPSNVTKLCENGDLRLVDGSVVNEGRVELCFHNRWGTVCDDHWTVESAQVVCGQLGYPTDRALTTREAFFGQGTGPIFLHTFSCFGNESHLLQCGSELLTVVGQHNCAHIEDAGVICPVLPEQQSCGDGDVRLSGGGKKGEGLVEICINNRWGTICGKTGANWDNNEAAVVCRQLGFDLADTRAVAVSGGGFGHGSGPIFLNNMECAGDESNLLQCKHSGIALQQPGCRHAFDAGVVCAVVPCTENDFRLVGGTNTSGRIEVCVGGLWGSICGDGFDNKTAAMICEKIGLKAGVVVRTNFFGSGSGSGGVFSVSVSESGFIVSRQEETCSHDNDAALFCLAQGVDEVCKPGDIQLVNGESPYEGRVEVCLDNKWGTICDDSWDNNSATVVCKQLEFEAGVPQSFGAGSRYQEILLDDTKCTGGESNLLLCQNNMKHNCNHGEDAGVICSMRSDTAVGDGLTTDQAVAITVPIVVVTILLVTACAIIIIFIIYSKFRTKQLDQAPIVDAENGIIAENGIHDDISLEKQKFEDKL